VLTVDAMRIACACLLLISCTDHYGELTITPTDGPPLGVGLTQQYTVTQVLCESGPDGDCGNEVSPKSLSVSIGPDQPAVASIGTGAFTLTGAQQGHANVGVTGTDGVITSFPIDVAMTAQTRLFVAQTVSGADYTISFPDVQPPFVAFERSQVTISQQSAGPDGSDRAGKAALVVDAGATEVALDPGCDCFTTGFTPGRASVSTALATAEIDIVDDSAISTFTFDNSRLAIEPTIGYADLVYLFPTDAAGHSILGRGPEPTATVADTSIVTVQAGPPGALRSLELWPLKAGTTTLDVTWGSAHAWITVRVLSP
jgi:hypothetical protein